MSKKIDALWCVVQHSGTGGAISFTPTPGLETPKSIALCANEVGMCVRIAQIYSGKKFTEDEIKDFIQSAGIGLAGGTVGAVGASIAGRTIANELLNIGGPIGWAIKGLLGTSLTASVGLIFVEFCKNRWGE